jgi:hypothetical protein
MEELKVALTELRARTPNFDSYAIHSDSKIIHSESLRRE